MGANTMAVTDDGNYITFSCRLEKGVVVRIDDLRSERRPIPTRMDMMREVLMAGLETLEKK